MNFSRQIFFTLLIFSLVVLPISVFAVNVGLEVTESTGGGGIVPPVVPPAPPVVPPVNPPPETPPVSPPSEENPPLPENPPPSVPPEVQPETPVVPPILTPIVTPVQEAMENVFQAGGKIINVIAEEMKEIANLIAGQTVEIVNELRANPDVQKTLARPEVDIPVKSIATFAVGTAVATGFISLMPLAMSLSDLAMLPFRLLSLIPFGIFFGKKRKDWGVVYDSISKQPLDPVYVVLKDKQGKELETRITDMKGRFGFLVQPGEYYIESNKTHYQFPSSKLLGSYDELYDNLYHGELLTIKNDKAVIINIPMDPLDVDWNETIKKNYVAFNYNWELFKRWFPEVLFIFGFLLTIIVWILQPTVFNQVMIWLFIALWILRYFGFKQRVWGMILDKKTKKPVPLAALKIYFEKLTQQIHHTVSDPRGRYYLLVDPGKYDLVVEQKIETGYKEVQKFESVRAKKGVLNKDLFIDLGQNSPTIGTPVSTEATAGETAEQSAPPQENTGQTVDKWQE